jgi:hypothetical protein
MGKGFPMVEIFSDELNYKSNSVNYSRIDEYQSRNDTLADLMRRLGI